MYKTRQKLSTVVNKRETKPETKEKIRKLNKIISFANREGLNTKGAYEYIIMNDGKAVSYIVQVAEPDQLQRVTWWYPIIGSVPYKGYFSKDEVVQEEKIWKEKGYDTHLSSAAAFSSLGWFEDPVFLSMLNRSESELAELIFHELVHRTVWIKDSVEFNEKFATYIAEKLTIEYLSKEKKHSLLSNYQQHQEDKELFHRWLINLKAELTVYYGKVKSKSLEVKLVGKKKIFEHHLSVLKPDFKRVNYLGSFDSWNNAKVLSYSLYRPDYKVFNQAFSCYKGRKVGDFVVDVGRYLEGSRDYAERLKHFCENKRSRG